MPPRPAGPATAASTSSSRAAEGLRRRFMHPLEAPMTDARQILQHVFGYPAFRGGQEAIVRHVTAGGDALVLMPTGGGKSLCYQIPALLRSGTAIVVSPLIVLMHDQVSALKEAGVAADFLNSSQDSETARAVERALLAGELKLLYVAPERLLMPRMLAMLDRLCEDGRLGLFAIDEAHCVSQWGHDFRPEYLQLSALHERYPAVPRIALTAPTSATASSRRTSPPPSFWTSCVASTPARPASSIACRAARWRRPPPGWPDRAWRPSPTTPAFPRRSAPNTSNASCGKTAW